MTVSPHVPNLLEKAWYLFLVKVVNDKILRICSFNFQLQYPPICLTYENSMGGLIPTKASPGPAPKNLGELDFNVQQRLFCEKTNA